MDRRKFLQTVSTALACGPALGKPASADVSGEHDDEASFGSLRWKMLRKSIALPPPYFGVQRGAPVHNICSLRTAVSLASMAIFRTKR